MSLLDRMSSDLLAPTSELVQLMLSAPHRYKVYPIPKRSGKGHRLIAQPSREVKVLQYWAAKRLLSKFKIHSCATGYRKGHSIASNARSHASSNFLLKMDFQAFFPSIKDEDFRACVEREIPGELEPFDIELLARLLFWKPRGENSLRLSIGAPTSPILSNAIMWPLDSEIASRATGQGVSYTRYSDDLTFSTNQPGILAKFEQVVIAACRSTSSPNLRIHPTKTVHSSRAHRRRVTGLILTNEGSVSLGRQTKRLLRAQVHWFADGKLDDRQKASLCGWLSYAAGVEPTFIDSLRRRYGESVLQAIRDSVSG